MKSFLMITLLGIITLGMFSCKAVDIRTQEVKTAFDQQRGKKVLLQMSEAHALNEWSKVQTYSFDMKDEFYGIMGKLGNPFPRNTADFEFQAIPYTFTSKAKFQDEKWGNKIWGIQSWKTYSGIAGQPVKFHKKNDKNIEFWLPTYQYFIELPLRIFEADVISYAGERELDGKNYDLVFASWKTDDPQKDIDQYILWIEKESHLLRFIQYTVRDQSPLIQATLQYKTYSKENGIVLIPTEMDVNLSGPNENKILHRMTVENIELNSVDKATLLINPDLGTKGKE